MLNFIAASVPHCIMLDWLTWRPDTRKLKPKPARLRLDESASAVARFHLLANKRKCVFNAIHFVVFMTFVAADGSVGVGGTHEDRARINVPGRGHPVGIRWDQMRWVWSFEPSRDYPVKKRADGRAKGICNSGRRRGDK